MTAEIPPITIAVECPEPDCESILCSRQLEHVVFTHLVEMHGCIDTVAHVVAYEASAPTAE